MIRVLLVLLCLLGTPLCAQRPASQGWERIPRLAQGTSLRVRLETGTVRCAFLHAEDASLTCVVAGHGLGSGATRTLDRADIRWIKGTRTAVSSVAGAAIGVGVGIAIGVGIDTTEKNPTEDGQTVPAVLGILGGILGLTAGHLTGFLAGPVLYQRS